MTYKVLANKYRPTRLSDLIGQDALVKTLSNAISKQKLHHAFLFSGTRGIGKTTVSRILAMTINCSSPILHEIPEPCMQCDNCHGIMSNSHPDVIEFDAASKTGVDSMRDIIESTIYSSAMAKYKIYIIDEAHMLSKSAFNALLKTLEEPPANIKFMLATTEVNKIPITVLSRCQKFTLRHINLDTLKSYMIDIAKRENIEYDDTSMAAIAKAADGSVRDAISMLDQAIILGDGKISNDTISEMMLNTDTTMICNFLESILNRNCNASLNTIDTLMNLGYDAMTIMINILDTISEIMKMQNCDLKEKDEYSNAILESFTDKYKNELSMVFLSRVWSIIVSFLKGSKYINDHTLLEVLSMQLIYAAHLPNAIDLIKNIDNAIIEEIKTLTNQDQ